MIGGVTRRMLPRLSGVPHLHANRRLESEYEFSLAHFLILTQESFCT